MRWVLAAMLLFRGVCCLGVAPPYRPTEVEVARHRAAVFEYAYEYIVDTFNLDVFEESKFNPVRFDSIGIWGDFEARVKELGGDSFEVQGWVIARGNGLEPIVWFVIVSYPLVDPEGWRYRRIDEPFVNEPDFLGWKFGDRYRSVPYVPEYHESFEGGQLNPPNSLSH